MASGFSGSQAFDAFAIHAVVRTGGALPFAACAYLRDFACALFCAFWFADACAVLACVFTNE